MNGDNSLFDTERRNSILKHRKTILYTGWVYNCDKNKPNFCHNSGYLAVIIRLLFNIHDALWLWHQRKGLFIVVYFKMTPHRDSRVKVSALLRAEHKVSRLQTLIVGVFRTTVYAIKTVHAGSGRKTVVDRDILRDAIRPVHTFRSRIYLLKCTSKTTELLCWEKVTLLLCSC